MNLKAKQLTASGLVTGKRALFSILTLAILRLSFMTEQLPPLAEKCTISLMCMVKAQTAYRL
jgi:hypothetical protein